MIYIVNLSVQKLTGLKLDHPAAYGYGEARLNTTGSLCFMLPYGGEEESEIRAAESRIFVYFFTWTCVSGHSPDKKKGYKIALKE